ncbi:MAG: NAD(P)-binding domain-containing protein, partial [Flavobacteriales bacterium]
MKLSKKINQFVDATISGGNLKAQSGDLSIFIGGNKKTVNKLKFVFN